MPKWTLTKIRQQRLINALRDGDSEWIRKALGWGLDPNACVPFNRAVPDPRILCAALTAPQRGDNHDVIAALLEAGADPNKPEDLPPLFWAMHKVHARLLLRAGADPSAKDHAGHTADKHGQWKQNKAEGVSVLVEFARRRAAGRLSTPLAHRGFVEFAARRAIMAKADYFTDLGLPGSEVSPDAAADWIVKNFDQLDYVDEFRGQLGGVPGHVWCAVIGRPPSMVQEGRLWWLTEKPLAEELATYKSEKLKAELDDSTPEAKEGTRDRWSESGGPL
ncbi:MAG: hypothetical protein KGO01_20685 [Burkholderiales bacterium]|nr:hypothetical protein [Burkholderiales bacterium]